MLNKNYWKISNKNKYFIISNPLNKVKNTTLSDKTLALCEKTKTLENKGLNTKRGHLLLALSQTKNKYANHYKGLQFKISGRIRGAQRARKIELNYGRISTQAYNASILFSKKQIFTKWGTWGSTIYISKSS